MKLTLDSIKNKMRTAYFNEAGREPERYSDTDNRLSAAATELFSVYSYADYIFRQAFVQTASGKYLDYHAELRGLSRKKAGKAQGTLDFYLAEPLEEDAVIPKGTVCSVGGKPFIQFETIEDAVIPAGDGSVVVNAQAVDTGERFNALQDEVNVIVNPPKYIYGVTNDDAFIGGADDETDEGLRERLLNIYKYESNALNESSIRAIALSCEEVRDAYIKADGSDFYLTLKMRLGNYIDADTQAEIEKKFSFLKLLGLILHTEPAEEKTISADVDIKAYSGADFDEIKQLAQSKIKDFCGAEKIGAPIRSYDIARALADLPYTYDVNITLSPSAAGTAVCSTREYLKLGELRVNVHE